MVIEVKQNGKFVKIPYITADVPVSEAPIDGKQYARQDATWSEIVIPEVDLTEVEANIAANTQAIAANTADIATLNSTVSNLPTAGSIVVTTDPRLTAATTTKAGLMTAADKVQLDSTLTATEIENKVNAAVSSVYRVKGNVATVSNLPTSNVAIGDVYNITDSGANYVAINNNPVEWDKLSETVDLAPYMQTSTANSTFVKKSGDTMTESLYIKGSGNKVCEFVDTNGTKRGYVGKIDTVSGQEGIWINNYKKHSLQLRDTGDLIYGGKKVILQDATDSITVRVPNDTNRRYVYGGNTIQIIPDDGTNATGIVWRNQANTANLAGIGTLTNGDSTTINAIYSYIGWTESNREPYAPENNLTVGRDKFTYKNNNVWHAGNDGAGSGLDADTVDGYQVGFKPNEISTNVNFPSHTDLINLGFLESSYPTQGYPVHSYLKALCKWAISTYTNLGDINLCGTAIPSSSGYCVLHLYSSNGSDSASGLPKYCSGSYVGTETIARIIKFGTTDGVWYSSDIANPTVVLTQAEYNALGSTVNSDGKIYFIKE